MTAKQVIEKAVAEGLTRVSLKPVRLTLKPPLSDAELRSFERELPGELPAEIAALLKFASGFELDVLEDEVDFRGRKLFELEEAFPSGIPILGDGFGNFWVVDVRMDTGAWGPVFFASHDPPVIVLQASSLADFLEQLFSKDVRKLAGDFVRTIQAENPFVVDVSTARKAGDLQLSAFASGLSGDVEICDLRSGVIGSGFSFWRPFYESIVKRFDSELIFAVEFRKKKGLLKRLFSSPG